MKKSIANTTSSIVTATVSTAAAPTKKYTCISSVQISDAPFVGNLGQINFSSNYKTEFGDKARVKFGVAVHDKNGNTNWRNTTLFGFNATEFNSRFKKGDFVAVTGRTCHEKWLNNETGEISEGDVIYDIFIEHKQPKVRVGF